MRQRISVVPASFRYAGLEMDFHNSTKFLLEVPMKHPRQKCCGNLAGIGIADFAL
jgi:hypothetical protein